MAIELTSADVNDNGGRTKTDGDNTTVNPDARVALVYRKFEEYRQIRRPIEIQWYINASAYRGFPDVRWNADLAQLQVRKEPAHRKRYRINYIKAKTIARIAKYTKVPPNPTVVPATGDREDIMNARASQKALEYIVKKASIRQKFMQVMQSVPITAKSYLVVRWDNDITGYAPSRDEESKKMLPTTGDVKIDFASAFDLFIGDPGLETIGEQPDVIRAKLVKVEDIKIKYKGTAGVDSLVGDADASDVFFYQNQVADLGARNGGMSSRKSTNDEPDGDKHFVLRLEHFVKPCAAYPSGQYTVVAGHKLLKTQDSLPGEFRLVSADNPYPFVEFMDDAAPGQFYPDAFVERMVELQKEYNEYRSKVAEALTMHMFPPLVTYNQAGLAADAYNNEAGQRLNINFIPGMPPPTFLQPANVASDAWHAIEHIVKEFDNISLIYPATVGGSGQATSGFQTSLLQEAADQVHGPAIQRNAYALEELFVKIRHLMKTFYDVPRMITIAGRNNIPEAIEFSANSIDEHADIRIEPDTMLPPMRSQRLDTIMQWAEKQLLGNIADPNVLKRIQDMARMHGFQEFDQDKQFRDEDQAQEENLMMERNEDLPKPQPWEDHTIHWTLHTDEFKSPETKDWDKAQWQKNVLHALVHLNYINPQQAMMMAGEFGLQPQLFQLQQMHAMQQQQFGGPQASPQQAPMGGQGGPMMAPPEQQQAAPPSPPEGQPGFSQPTV